LVPGSNPGIPTTSLNLEPFLPKILQLENCMESYIISMQIDPSKYSQSFLTVVGLSLLVLALLLNHYHPRNQGVADLSHGSIYKLSLKIAGLPEASPTSNIILRSIPPSFSTAKAHVNTPVPKMDDAAQPSAASAIGEVSPDNAACNQFENQQAGTAQMAYSNAYRQYLKSKSDLETTYKPDSRDKNEKKNTYWQTYLASLQSTFSDYQLAVANQGCQAQLSAPTPQDQ
jgi:hypothetical protein